MCSVHCNFWNYKNLHNRKTLNNLPVGFWTCLCSTLLQCFGGEEQILILSCVFPTGAGHFIHGGWRQCRYLHLFSAVIWSIPSSLINIKLLTDQKQLEESCRKAILIPESLQSFQHQNWYWAEVSRAITWKGLRSIVSYCSLDLRCKLWKT